MQVLLSGYCISAQSLTPTVSPAAGGFSTGGGITLSWTMGETFTQSLQASPYVLNQGFQQAGNVNTYYADSDGDGYGNTSVSIMSDVAVAGYVLNNTDCNDNNASVHPGATEICGNGIDDNCNGFVDENCCDAPAGLNTTNITSTSAKLNWSPVSGASRYVVRYRKSGAGQTWVSITVKAPATSVTLTNLSPSSQYRWTMKARCANGFSTSSVIVPFTTASAASSITTSNNEQGVDNITTADIINNSLMISPNPATDEFIIKLLAGNKASDATVQVLNGNGNIVYTAQVPVVNGVVSHKVYTSGKFVQGEYFIKVITNDDVYTGNLIIMK